MEKVAPNRVKSWKPIARSSWIGIGITGASPPLVPLFRPSACHPEEDCRGSRKSRFQQQRWNAVPTVKSMDDWYKNEVSSQQFVVKSGNRWNDVGTKRLRLCNRVAGKVPERCDLCRDKVKIAYACNYVSCVGRTGGLPIHRRWILTI